MTNQRRLNTSKAPEFASPLWIVALFIALSEIVAGIAAIATDGTTRLIFTVFAVGFPIAILIAFLWLILNHPANLYGPWQYTSEASVATYVAALRRETQDTTAVLRYAVSEAVATAVATDDAPRPSDSGLRPGERSAIDVARDRATSTFDNAVAASAITVHLTLLGDDAEPLIIPVQEHTTVQNLLDSVWIALDPAVKPYSYAQSWILVRDDGTVLDKIGAGTERADSRRLDTVGISSGSTLRAVRAQGRRGVANVRRS